MINKSEYVVNTFIKDLREIILDAKKNAVRSVNSERVHMYWKLGKRILVEEQASAERAAYGKNMIQKVSHILSEEFGSGFSESTLIKARRFHKTFPDANALRPQLNWFQYRLLTEIEDSDKREYYEHEAISNNWTGRELERQINALLYERLLMSSDKERVLEIARSERIPENPTDIIKDPMFLEFLDLERLPSYTEREMESALITHLQKFLLELGNGFSFVARQKRITLEDDHFFIDLVFYNRLLRAHVLVEIVTKKVTHEDLGQLQMYVNYYDRIEKEEFENKTIGILLCTAKNDELVKFALPEDNNTILASKYQLYLPSATELISQIGAVEQRLIKEAQAKYYV